MAVSLLRAQSAKFSGQGLGGRVVVGLVALSFAVTCGGDPSVIPRGAGGAGTGGSNGAGAGGSSMTGGTGFVLPDASAGGAAGPGSCGDGVSNPGESCDDGNGRAGDGCSTTCAVEPGYECPGPGQACRLVPRCGNQVVNDGEACDDGNTAGNDGCSAMCQIEPGWSCAAGGVCKAARCGDGLKIGAEECDDGNAASGDGCSTACFVEAAGATEANGWNCPTPGQACVRTMCGDAKREGSEPCDDGNNDLGDGCTPFCRREPVCPAAGGPATPLAATDCCCRWT